MDYYKILKSFLEYTNGCRQLIRENFFAYDDCYGLYVSNENLSFNEIVRNHRLKMIDIKVDHTMRMIEQIIKINENLGFKVNLGMILKVAVLYHDIGRMRQATWSNTFGDSIYLKTNSPFKNHGEDGYDIFINNDFSIDEKYIPVIGNSIKYHQDYYLYPKLQYKYNTDICSIDIDSIVTGKMNLNDTEWEITSLIVQLVADIDKSDILYQHLSDDFNMIRDYVDDKSMDTLDNISKYWCVSKEEICRYNNIASNNYSPRILRIPIKNMDLNRLIVPGYMKEMFYNNSWLELRELVKDRNWNFITILWWRLSHFLNEISFSSVLINIEESKLLDQMYEKVPIELRFLVEEAFAYSRDKLVRNRIKESDGLVYIKKR